jgi:hypothetical protein
VAQPYAAHAPAGEIVCPRFLNSLATRTWPKAGCSSANETTASSISCSTRFFSKTITERDSAIKAAIIRLMAEPDKEVQEALLLWQARRMNIGKMTIDWPDATETTEWFNLSSFSPSRTL